MSGFNIKQLDQVISLFDDSCVAILEQNVERLTLPGENYGSLMLAVEIKYKTKDDKDETLQVVAKMIPENEWLRKMFKVEITFKKELEMYNTIFPTLINFQKEQGMENTINFFPKYYGGRLNLLEDSNEVTEDGIIILENLKNSGYVTVDRTKGFDFEEAQFILKNLAVFHALPLALKMKKPDVFREKILPHLKVMSMFTDIDAESEELLNNEKVELARSNPFTADLAGRVKEGMALGNKNFVEPNLNPEGPFITIVHNDFWVNNTMVKYEDGKIKDNKIIDYQIVDYGSLAKDVIFFLFSSVQLPVIKDSYDELLNSYYNRLIETLKDFNCDTECFNFRSFNSELDREAKNTQFFHLMCMLNPIYASKEDVKDLKDMCEDDLKVKNITNEYKEKAFYLMNEFARRRWI